MMDSTPVTLDMVHTFMPFPTLTKCKGELTYPEMTVIQKEIYQNLASINSPFGQGQAGFLCMMML